MTLLSDEAERYRRVAVAHRRAALLAQRQAAHYEQGERGEKVVRKLLDGLQGEGWRVLHRRHWPGTRRADIDHLLIGPGGVVVLDSKAWSGQVRVSAGRLWQGQDDVSHAVDGLLAQVSAIEEILLPHGLAPAAVTGALVFVGQPIDLVQLGRVYAVGEQLLLRWLRALGARLDTAAVAELARFLEQAAPPLPAAADALPVVRTRPRPRSVSTGQGELFATAHLDIADVERASRLALEQWMVYLHPSQLDIVRRRYNGPCRVRGPAGSGKTVVALHRAAYLAQQEPGELLFLSYVRTLPVVLASLFARLAPHSADRVAFRSVHSAALDVLSRAGVAVRLDATGAQTCFSLAWSRVGREHLDRPDLPVRYWQEEVRNVIKGRGLQDFTSYASLSRTGRRTPLSAEERRRVWDLYVAYQSLLDERGVHDFQDVVALALQATGQGAEPPYRFVLVDEAQDLDLLSVRLAAALASPERDGLTLVGDGQQALYAGGYTLKEAGLSVVGRSAVLDTNYRNTRQVLAAAQDVVRRDDFDDLEDVAESGQRTSTALRDGRAVQRVDAADPVSARVALVTRLQEDVALGLRPADAAVLCRTRTEAAGAKRVLRAVGLRVLDLEDYDGTAVDAVKVGTVKRAKGLEFGRVYLPRVDSYLVLDGAAEPETVQRERRELFVAMTRARDGLWLCRVRPGPAADGRSEVRRDNAHCP